MSLIIPENALISFTYMGNCGSESFSRALREGTLKGMKTLPNRRVSELTEEEANGLRLLYGHDALPLATEIYGRPVVYITMARNPIRRFISDYNWCRGFYFGDQLRESKDTVDWQSNRDAILKEKEENGSTFDGKAFLDSLESLDSFAEYAAGRTIMPTIWTLVLDTCRDSFSEKDAEDPNLVERVVSRMHQTWSLIGITELFEESLFTVSRALRLPPPAPWVRLGPFKPTFHGDYEVPPETIEKIRKCRTLECGIYDRLRADFEAELAAFSFDDEFLEYKANSLLRDGNLLRAYLNGRKTYLSETMTGSADAMHRFGVALLRLAVLSQQEASR